MLCIPPPSCFEIQLLGTSEIRPLFFNDGSSDFLVGFTLSVKSAGQPRFINANVAARRMQVSETIEKAAMSLSLAIAIARLLDQYLWDFSGNGVSFMDIADLELNRIERRRKRQGIRHSPEIDRHWI